MTIWTPINEDTIAHYLSSIQLSALQNHGHPLQEIIADTIAWVRAEVQTNPHNQVNKHPDLIPLELKSATCHLIIEALQSRIPSLKLSDDQIRNAKNARSLLKRVAGAEISLSPQSPLMPGHVTIAHSRPSLFSSSRHE